MIGMMKTNLTDPQEAYYESLLYAKRIPELEPVILTSSCYAEHYAENVIKGRWEEAEDIIMVNPFDSYFYAVRVIKGRLPDKMHNMMVLHILRSPKGYAKDYFNFINKQEL